MLKAPAFAMSIGRSSRSEDGKLFPRADNGWFDSRVVSREHAVIKAFPDMNAVFIEDAGSMHGTFVNEHKVGPREKEMLANGDQLRFGADVSRGPGMSNKAFIPCPNANETTDVFPPVRARLTYEWIKDWVNVDDIASVFEVSDGEGSDIELIEESYKRPDGGDHTTPYGSRIFSVPDSDISAAGSFVSDDDDLRDEQDDNFLPSSARTLMKELQPLVQDYPVNINSDKHCENAPSHQPPTPPEETAPVVEVVVEGRSPEAPFVNGESKQENAQIDPHTVIVGTPVSKPTDISQLITESNITESDSDSNYSEEEYPIADDSMCSDTSESVDTDNLSTANVGRNEWADDPEHLHEMHANENGFDGHNGRIPPYSGSSWEGVQSGSNEAPLDSPEYHRSTVDHQLDHDDSGYHRLALDTLLPAPPSRPNVAACSLRLARLPSPSDAAMPKPSTIPMNEGLPPFNTFPEVPGVHGQAQSRPASKSDGLPGAIYSTQQPHQIYRSVWVPKVPDLDLDFGPLDDVAPYYYDEAEEAMRTWGSSSTVTATGKTKLTIDEIVDKQSSRPSSPTILKLKRKRDDISDLNEPENGKATGSSVKVEQRNVVSCDGKSNHKVTETPAVNDNVEPPNKKAKFGFSESSGPTIARYAAVASAGAIAGALGLFGALVSLPPDYFAS